MINRLPKEYSSSDPLTASPQPSRSTGVGGFAPASEPLQQRVLTAAANSVGSHPMASLGAAFVVGIILGKLVKR